MLFGWIDRHIMISLSGGGRPTFCHLDFGYAGRQASATETAFNRVLLV